MAGRGSARLLVARADRTASRSAGATMRRPARWLVEGGQDCVDFVRERWGCRLEQWAAAVANQQPRLRQSTWFERLVALEPLDQLNESLPAAAYGLAADPQGLT
jgi:hypothetical protein